MNYELYRRSTIGQTLTDALDELIQSEQITPQLAMRVLSQYDRSMTDALASRIRSRAIFKVLAHFCVYIFKRIIHTCCILGTFAYVPIL